MRRLSDDETLSECARERSYCFSTWSLLAYALLIRAADVARSTILPPQVCASSAHVRVSYRLSMCRFRVSDGPRRRSFPSIRCCSGAWIGPMLIMHVLVGYRSFQTYSCRLSRRAADLFQIRQRRQTTLLAIMHDEGYDPTVRRRDEPRRACATVH